MIARFNFHDFLANMIPGLMFLWCAQRLSELAGWTLPMDFAGGLAETSILITLSYITGLLFQGLSQGLVEKHILKPLWGGFPSERWLLPEDKHFSEAYKTRLLDLIREQFGVSTDPDLPPDCSPKQERKLRLKKNYELFRLVFHAIGEASPRPQIFNAHYGLFRVLLTMFSGLSLASLAGFVWGLCCRPDVRLAFGMWSTVFVAATFIAYFRCKKRSEDFAQSVYDLFMVTDGGKSSLRNQV